MRLAVLFALAGCGRLGFDGRDGATGDDGGAPPTDGAGSDAGDGALPGTTVTFGESSTAMVQGVTRDTYISMDVPTINYGSADDIRAEADNGEHGLIAFDLTAIPAGATVTLGKITFTHEKGPIAATITVHPILEDWAEGNADGSAGSANYQFRSGILPWSIPGAGQPTSTGAPIVTFSAASTPAVVTLPNTVVQGWIDDPANNFGVLMSSDSNETVRFVSSEGADLSRPTMTVTYE